MEHRATKLLGILMVASLAWGCGSSVEIPDSGPEPAPDGGVPLEDGGEPLSCGDGVVSPDEECDDGAAANDGAYGGCNVDCTLAPFCGDGAVDPSEECDLGEDNDDTSSSCSSRCESTSLLAHLTAADVFGSGVTPADGFQIDSWCNQSGSAAATQPDGAARPVYRPSAIHGQPALEFDGLDDRLILPVDIDSTTLPEVTVVVVFQNAPGNPSTYAGVWGQDDGGWDRFLSSGGSALGNAGVSDGSRYEAVPGITVTQGRPLVAVTTMRNGAGPDTSTVHLNGALATRFTEAHTNPGARQMAIGSLNGPTLAAPGYVFDGYLAEVFVYASALSDAEREALEAGLLDRYGAEPFGDATDASWNTNATDRSCADDGVIGSTRLFRCPAGGGYATVWGTDYYTHDSSICTAAVHAGVIESSAAGGEVLIEASAGRGTYFGSSRNGVTTLSYPAWPCSYRMAPSADPLPEGLVHDWGFDDGTARDAVGGADGTLMNGAAIVDGALVLDGVDDYMRTGDLPASIGERTMVVWVRLANLEQRAGSALTLEQYEGGDVFDGVVYAEQTARQWMAGSEVSNRTLLPGNGGPVEDSTAYRMIAITYDADGGITLYRDGQPYAARYVQGSLVTYPAGASDVLIGVRHEDRAAGSGTASGVDAFLAGSVERAMIFGRALGAEEIARLYASAR